MHTAGMRRANVQLLPAYRPLLRPFNSPFASRLAAGRVPPVDAFASAGDILRIELPPAAPIHVALSS